MSELIVIEGGGEDGGPPICTVRKGSTVACRHRRVQLDGQARKVLCKECGAERDPFDALLVLADRLEHYKGWGERYKRESKQAAQELEDVKRQVRNAKAQLRRAQSSIESPGAEREQRHGEQGDEPEQDGGAVHAPVIDR